MAAYYVSPFSNYSPKYDFKLLMCTLILIIMAFQSQDNDLLFALESADSGNQLLEAIEAYVDGQVQEVE